LEQLYDGLLTCFTMSRSIGQADRTGAQQRAHFVRADNVLFHGKNSLRVVR
jgi:hypothetical protein